MVAHQSNIYTIVYYKIEGVQQCISLHWHIRTAPAPSSIKFEHSANIYIISSTWIKSFEIRSISIEVVLLTFNLPYFKMDSSDAEMGKMMGNTGARVCFVYNLCFCFCYGIFFLFFFFTLLPSLIPSHFHHN